MFAEAKQLLTPQECFRGNIKIMFQILFQFIIRFPAIICLQQILERNAVVSTKKYNYCKILIGKFPQENLERLIVSYPNSINHKLFYVGKNKLLALKTLSINLLSKECPNNLYVHYNYTQDISGVPGIGKTLSVNRAIEQIQNERQDLFAAQRCKVKIIKINAMKLKQSTDIYKNIYLQLYSVIDKKKRKISSHNALVALDGIFRKNQLTAQDQKLATIKKILFIDQIDFLRMKQQTVLYNLFDWTQSDKSKLAIIAISNTIHFPQQLPPKILSRIGNIRLIFRQYKYNQLVKILSQRISQTDDVFDKKAVQVTSKKIARGTVDIRKCFQVLRQAVYRHVKNSPISELKNSRITEETVIQAYEYVFADDFNELYRSLPTKYRKICAIIAQHYLKDTVSIKFQILYQNALNKYKMDQDSVKYIVISLQQMGIVQFRMGVNKSLFSHCSKFQNQWNVKLLIQVDKIKHASVKFDTSPMIQ